MTRRKPEIHAKTILGGVEVAVAYGDFDSAKEALESQGYNIISLKENARLRMLAGIDSKISNERNWTRKAFLYVPKKGIFLTTNSPIMQNPIEATQAHLK